MQCLGEGAGGIATPSHDHYSNLSFKHAYEGPERISISSDKDLEGYYNRFASSGNEGDDGDKYDARRDPALTDVIKELEAMRLGGILTKMQMTKYLRLLGDNRMLYLKTVKELQRTRDELYELQEGLPAKIELAVNRAVTKREVELLKQAEQEKGLLLAKCREESQKMLKPLQDAAENSKKALKDIQVQFQKTKSLLSKTETKLAAAEETVRTADARYRDSQEQLHDTERLLQDTRAEREELERALADANEVIDSNGLERPGGSGSSGEDGSGGSGAKNSFSWNIPKIQSKVSWPRERSVCSSDKKLASLSSVVVEFYPGGVEASFPGYCALRLHVPDKTRLSWGVVFGKMKKTHDCGKRSDDFAKHLWWCRSGILWPNVCKLEDVKRNIDRHPQRIWRLGVRTWCEGETDRAPGVELERWRVDASIPRRLYSCGSPSASRGQATQAKAVPRGLCLYCTGGAARKIRHRSATWDAPGPRLRLRVRDLSRIILKSPGPTIGEETSDPNAKGAELPSQTNPQASRPVSRR
eukprot:g6146.t1